MLCMIALKYSIRTCAVYAVMKYIQHEIYNSFETFDRGTACFFVVSLMLLSATITTGKCDWPSQARFLGSMPAR